MSERSKILFPTDLSKNALKAFGTAKHLAKMYDADLYLMHVIEAPTGVAKMFSSFNADEARQHGLELLDKLIAANKDPDINYHKLVKVGVPYKKVLEAAKELGTRLVIMSTHGASGIREVMVGSNASRVIQHSPCPVLTIREKPDHLGFKKILLPIDLTIETGEKVNWGIKFAKKFDSELVVLTIVRSADESDHAKLQKRAEKSIAHIESKGIKAESAMLVTKENVSHALMNYSKEIGADLLCIMTQQESKEIAEYLLGGHAARIVNHSDVPVMSIKPEKEYRSSSFSGAHFG